VVSHLLFDLDNTLYPASSGLEGNIVELMTEYAARHLEVSYAEAEALRKNRYPIYGTTLEWLKREHGPVDPEAFFRFVHPDGEENILKPDPRLGELLRADPLPKTIFTNAPSEHAERVLRRLGILECFTGIYDIRYSQFRGKPAAEPFERVLSDLGIQARQTAFFDDSPRAIQTFRELGGHGFLVDDLGIHAGSGMSALSSILEYPQALVDIIKPRA
jgi:putative hydrolase of the HAD superfamily